MCVYIYIYICGVNVSTVTRWEGKYWRSFLFWVTCVEKYDPESVVSVLGHVSVCSVNVSNVIVTRQQYQRWFLFLVTCVEK